MPSTITLESAHNAYWLAEVLCDKGTYAEYDGKQVKTWTLSVKHLREFAGVFGLVVV